MKELQGILVETIHVALYTQRIHVLPGGRDYNVKAQSWQTFSRVLLERRLKEVGLVH